MHKQIIYFDLKFIKFAYPLLHLYLYYRHKLIMIFPILSIQQIK